MYDQISNNKIRNLPNRMLISDETLQWVNRIEISDGFHVLNK